VLSGAEAGGGCDDRRSKRRRGRWDAVLPRDHRAGPHARNAEREAQLARGVVVCRWALRTTARFDVGRAAGGGRLEPGIGQRRDARPQQKSEGPAVADVLSPAVAPHDARHSSVRRWQRQLTRVRVDGSRKRNAGPAFGVAVGYPYAHVIQSLRLARFRGLAFGLLALQLTAGGAIAAAHARERLDAPVRFEGTQHQRCPVVHDQSACGLCSYSHSQAVVRGDVTSIGSSTNARPTTFAAVMVHRSRAPDLIAAPRGPPAVTV